ncbi:MAG: penicillin-binding protein 2 [Candidatus Krumholzibacteria bacterium]|nr:penicillin-binding protein 2 [Candidatus Krumholzibacteria bacterium]
MAGTDRQSEFILDHRRRIVLLLVIGVISIMTMRLFYLQVIHHGYYNRLAISNRIQRERMVAPRGLIRASDGSKLVVNVPVYQISLVPGKITGREDRLELACEWLGIDSENLFDSLAEWKKKYPDGREMPVVQSAEKGQISILMENRSLFPFFKLVMKHRRQYPEGDLATHVLGYVGEVTDEELKDDDRFRPGDLTGRTGIEYKYDEYLRGDAGVRIIEISAEGIKVGEYDGISHDNDFDEFVQSRSPVPGCDLYLTIDLDLQKVMEREFDCDRGCIIAMDPSTGGILGAVSRPSYDPNIFMGGISEKDWNMLHGDPAKPLFNRTIQATYPPASTFKLIVCYGALYFELVPKNAWLEPCYGGYQFGNRYFRCWKPEGHGYANMFDAIVNSCDVYFYQIGERMNADQFAYAGRIFGLGRKTGVDLPSEARGTLPDHSYFDRRFGKRKWTKGHLLNYSIGQGEVLTTPIQLCQMVAMIANGGKRIKPHLVDRVVDTEGAEIYRSDNTAVPISQMNNKILKFIQRSMVAVVSGEHGTGRASRIPGVTSAGKTGTAQNSGEDHALFVAYAPVEAPEIAVAIIMENAGHGGAMAAPMARRILSAYFNPGAAWNGKFMYGKTIVAGADR